AVRVLGVSPLLLPAFPGRRGRRPRPAGPAPHVRRALLVRHAESELGARGLVDRDAHTAHPPTTGGREQAARLAERLPPEPIDLCVTSRFERARETADLALDGR